MFEGKYKYTDKELKALLKSIVVLYDGREQKNEHILNWFNNNNIKYERKTLQYGDYSFYLPKNEELDILRDMYFIDKICVERKNSIDELIGNFATDRNRIENEFIRHKGKMTLIVENNSYKDIINGMYKSKYSSKSAIGTLHSFSEKYNVDFIFLDKDSVGCFLYCKFYYYLRSLFI